MSALVEAVPSLRAYDLRRRWLLPLAVMIFLAAAGASVAGVALGGWYHPLAPRVVTSLPDVENSAGKAPVDVTKLESQLARLRPRGLYVVVDTYANRLRVYRKGELEREMVCSTGSGIELRDPRTGKVWIFDTPRGEREVERKVQNPVWIKPDWAFIESGQAPPERFKERIDADSLGDYGLYLGDGYIIHGTIFQTLLGRRLTHGCIRLGDADLEYVYREVPLGTRVYLY